MLALLDQLGDLCHESIELPIHLLLQPHNHGPPPAASPPDLRQLLCARHLLGASAALSLSQLLHLFLEPLRGDKHFTQEISSDAMPVLALAPTQERAQKDRSLLSWPHA